MIILNVNIQERSAKRGKCELYLDTIKQIKETKRTTTVPSLTIVFGVFSREMESWGT
jgi:hypothetical protein